MERKRIAINGFGRIGRLVYRMLANRKDVACVAINDLSDPETLVHLLKYDSAHGRFDAEVTLKGDILTVNGHQTRILSEKDPTKLPWGDLKVDLVLECSGAFTKRKKLQWHRQAGAGKVILSAPAKDEEVPTFVMGVNDHLLTSEDDIISNASCTTNCLAPVIKIIDEHFELRSGFVTTTHAYTADQRLQDAPHRDLRRARAAGVNIVPTSTGAAKATALVYPPSAGKLDAIALRVPVISGSIIDVNVLVNASPSREEVNAVFKAAAETSMKGILQYTEEPLVSTDIIGSTYSCILDASLTQSRESFLKIIAWYDNEAGYAARMVDMAMLVLGLGISQSRKDAEI